MIDRQHSLPLANQAKALGISRGTLYYASRSVPAYPSGEPHIPFQVKPLSSVLMDDLKVAHKYGGDDGA
jgi:hypothetical protein